MLSTLSPEARGQALRPAEGVVAGAGHGAWVAEAEVREIVAFLRQQGQAVYEEGLLQPVKEAAAGEGASEAERDEGYWRAVELVVSQKQASISFIQRRLGLGYPKAARFIDLMEQDRIIGPGEGAKPRQILVGPDCLVRRGAPRGGRRSAEPSPLLGL